MKKVFMLCMVGLMLTFNTGCDITNAQTSDILPKVALVAKKGSLENEAYAEMAYAGILKASQDYNVEVLLTEPENKAAYIEAVSDAAAEADLVVAVGHAEADEIIKIADNNPETLFAVLDSYEDAPDNVMCLSFKEEEGAFLAGVIASLTSETHKIGFIGGVKDEATKAFEYGFRAGVLSANPDTDVTVKYTDCFDDPQKGKEAALALIEEGVDVIFHPSGRCSEGVIEVADNAGIQTIGSDAGVYPMESNSVLCSVYKRVDYGVYLSVQSFMEGKFLMGSYNFGLDFEAVGYSDCNGKLDKETKARTDAFAAAVLSGSIIVPKNHREFSSFKIPDGETLLLQGN
ncbi:BMP family ABC transporter substrate-binding protein [Bacillota bacterium]